MNPRIASGLRTCSQFSHQTLKRKALLRSNEWPALVWLHWLLTRAATILLYEGFSPLLFQPLTRSFAKDLRSFVATDLSDSVNLFKQLFIKGNRNSFHEERSRSPHTIVVTTERQKPQVGRDAQAAVADAGSLG